ncbi:MAG: type II secretion system F family protein, partial [Chromatiales bacterium]|nr:type II secretion system F family protein [Chromatiales bacterium]
FVVLGAIGVCIFLVVVVVPRFAKFLNTRDVEIPASTQALMDIADWFQTWGQAMAGITTTLIFGLLVAYTTQVGKRVIDRGILALPVVGKSITYAAMAQAGWTLAMLLRSGVTALQSLRITSGVIGNLAVADGFDYAADRILEGRSLSSAFEQRQIPMMMRHMAAVGERSGQLDTVMQELGEYYRKELEALIKIMTAMVEPALILIVGGMVGFVYYAFFQAVLKVSTGGM